MKRRTAFAMLAAAIAIATPAIAAPFDKAVFLADLEQARQSLHDKYANRYWVEAERGVTIDALFEDLKKRMERAQTEAQAVAVFARLQRTIGDGHVEIEWPEPPSAPQHADRSGPSPPQDLCSKLGYDRRQNRPGTAQAFADYRPIIDKGNPFDAGLAPVGQDQLGIIRIGIFQPQGYPTLCQEAVRDLAIPPAKPCDENCEDKIVTWAYRRLTDALEQRARELKAAGATTLLLDITNNGGGSEWAEAAARIFSAKLLVSERRGFVRGEHWAKQWRDLSADLRAHAKKGSKNDRASLLAWARAADAAEQEALKSCEACPQIATAGFSTGLVGSAPSGSFAGKDWGVLVFSPSQFSYHDGVWAGPLLVLVDEETWSAAEEFAAVIQDNKAGVIIGSRTGGAGCGYTNGGTPTVLKNTGAVLKLPDCVRLRADGSNELRGIIPDEVVGIRANDGERFRAELISRKLGSAIARAKQLVAQEP